MGQLVVVAVALSAWIVLWALGRSPFDGLLLAGAIMVIAAGVHIAGRRFSSSSRRD